ncbi:hypothetical protein ACO0SA_000593 [Hanseniaspora valbyensis]
MVTKRVPYSKRHITEPRWARDIQSPSEMFKNIFVYGNKEVAWFKTDGNKFESPEEEEELKQVLIEKHELSEEEEYIEMSPKEKRKTIIEMFFACFCLAAEGYVGSVTSTVNSGLKYTYGPQYYDSVAISNISSIGAAGMIFAFLLFGYLSDKIGRKKVTLIGNAIVIICLILLSGATTKGTQFEATADRYYLDKNTGKHYPIAEKSFWSYITFLRFSLGVGIGSEYPGATAWAADLAKKLKAKERIKWIILFSSAAVTTGYFLGVATTLVVVTICGEDHYQYVWRWCVGLGAVLPTFFFIGRLRVREAESFEKNRFKTGIPYLLTLKVYWFRVLFFGLSWFCYDMFSSGFSSVESIIFEIILGPSASKKKVWEWNLLFEIFYLVGTFAGSQIAARFGVRYVCFIATMLQGVIGLVLYFCLPSLKHNVGVFTLLYGLFVVFSNVGFGNNVFMFCSAGFATPVRGLMFGLCSTIAKIGSLSSGYIIPKLVTHGGTKAAFLLAAIFAMCSGAAFLFVPPLDQVTQQLEDKRFMEYLEVEGYDISTLTAHDYIAKEDNKVVEEIEEDSVSESEKDAKIKVTHETDLKL